MGWLKALRSGIEARRLHKVCEEKLAHLPLPTPFSVPGLVSAMETVGGRAIRLIPIDDRAADLRTACGLRLKGRSTTYVLYRRRPTPNQTEHTILHELAHEWLDHGTSMPLAQVARSLPVGAHRELAEALGTDTVVQARARYDTAEEREAELSASLIKSLARHRRPAGEDLVSLLELSLSHPVAAPRQSIRQK
ncbi:hypothetical protein ACIO6T_19045 [Streptomyces sp. NPDC087532]|uniref:hypothetical protein n=1 Tax=unclassified Streptomyces TaxID=2593676 RepID=UPI003331B6B6